MKVTSREEVDGMRILVVDDEPANVQLMTRILAWGGYEAVQCTTRGRDVVGLCTTFDPDLILLDLHMPGHDGYAVLRDLAPVLADRGWLPILMLTGDSSVEATEGAVALGATDYLAKPFNATEVLIRIRSLLEARCLYCKPSDRPSLLESTLSGGSRGMSGAVPCGGGIGLRPQLN